MKIYIGETPAFFVPCHPSENVSVDVSCHKICVNAEEAKSLSGYVYNACTGKTIEGAEVIIKNEIYCEKCLTDCRGHYELFMPALNMTYDVRISKRGYKVYCEDELYLRGCKEDFKLFPRRRRK